MDLAGSSAADTHWSVLVGCLLFLRHSYRLECELIVKIIVISIKWERVGECSGCITTLIRNDIGPRF